MSGIVDLATLFKAIIGPLGDIDTIDTWEEGDYNYVKFSTTCLRGKIGDFLSNLKLRAYMFLDVPVKIAEVTENKRVQDNPIFSQHVITLKVPKKARLVGDLL